MVLGGYTRLFIGFVFANIEIGLMLAVGLSIMRVLLFVARPRTLVLGNIPDTKVYRNVDHYENANNVPGILILEIDSPIYFANSNYLRERISRWIDDEEEKIKSSGETGLQYVVLDMSAVGNIDTSGISMLDEVKKMVDQRGLKVREGDGGYNQQQEGDGVDHPPQFTNYMSFSQNVPEILKSIVDTPRLLHLTLKNSKKRRLNCCQQRDHDFLERMRHPSAAEFVKGIKRYNVEIVVADESDTAKMTLWNRATQKLLGEPAEDVISLYGDTARVMPDDIAEKILGKEGLFEVVICSQRSYDDGFNVSRLTVGDEIKDAYIMRNFPAAYEPSS
ncbi:hypothetical protein CASFOL_010405 [Castilleja foliolosa]|uniref:STAS domain-containing protein n=1 Tax=Castilleja foliolosa TaxID=1961234 RepID=A0ABD3DSG1_9LAMI